MRSCLIVDDSAASRRVVAAAVKAAQKGVIEFHEAETVEAAMKLFDLHTIDVARWTLTSSSST
jgi:hypothetical protein